MHLFISQSVSQSNHLSAYHICTGLVCFCISWCFSREQIELPIFIWWIYVQLAKEVLET